MKRLLFTLLMALPLVMAAQVKLGIVNSQEIFKALPEKVAAENVLQQMSDKYKAEDARIQEDFNKKFAEYQELASDANTPETIKERRIQELQQLDKGIQNYHQEVSQLLDQAREEAMKPILDKIQQAIEAVGEEEGMAIVFDTAKTPVAYVGPYTEDITPKVKARLGL